MMVEESEYKQQDKINRFMRNKKVYIDAMEYRSVGSLIDHSSNEYKGQNSVLKSGFVDDGYINCKLSWVEYDTEAEADKKLLKTT
eukprot:Pgem_evm1s2888